MTETTDTTEQPAAKVTPVPGGWHLVECGDWQVSVGPDGMIMLPRFVHPREINDFVGAMLAAGEVAEKVVAENAKNHREVDLENLPSDSAIVTEGPPPPGAVKMTITESGQPRPAGTIGRPKRRDARAPREPQPPGPPMRGAKNGRAR